MSCAGSVSTGAPRIEPPSSRPPAVRLADPLALGFGQRQTAMHATAPVPRSPGQWIADGAGLGKPQSPSRTAF
jgi:hypothetical protein